MDPLREKIRKLLALSGNNPNEAEAIAAITKARALMAEHGLSEQELAGVPDGVKKFAHAEEILARPKGHLPKWQESLVMRIAGAFRCTTFLDVTIPDRDVIVIIGLPEDVAIVQDTFTFAVKAALKLGWRWSTRQTPRPDETGMNGYYIGFSNGIASAFTEQTTEHPEWGLVMVQDPVVRRAVDDLGLKPSKRRGARFTRNGLKQGYEDGYHVGKGDRMDQSENMGSLTGK